MHTFKKKKSDGQKDDMRFLTLVTGNFHGILHHVLVPIHVKKQKIGWEIHFLSNFYVFSQKSWVVVKINFE